MESIEVLDTRGVDSPLKGLLHRSHWVLIRKIEDRAGDLGNLLVLCSPGGGEETVLGQRLRGGLPPLEEDQNH